MRHPSVISWFIGASLVLAAEARAQPIPPVPLPPQPQPQPPPDGEPTPPPDGDTPPPPVEPTDAELAAKAAELEAAARAAEAAAAQQQPPPAWGDDPIERAITPDPASPAIHFPLIFTAPSGRMLPAAVIWSSSGVHTGGGYYGDLFVGLGDVAEFGVGVTDLIRVRPAPGEDPLPIEPFGQASFKMGVPEDRFVRYQPAISLAFRKSFEHTFGTAKVRTAALYLMATKSLGSKVSVHAGGVLWDAAIREPMADAYFFHDEGLEHQIAPVLAIEAEPKDGSSIMVELNWVPEFTRAPADIELSAMLTWGVRYRITPLFAFESGVRVQGIDDANLLDAQIFGQLSWGSDRLRRAIQKLR
jgi:hypothetical protein